MSAISRCLGSRRVDGVRRVESEIRVTGRRNVDKITRGGSTWVGAVLRSLRPQQFEVLDLEPYLHGEAKDITQIEIREIVGDLVVL